MWYRPSRWTLAAFAFAVVSGFIAWLILGRGDRTMRLADGREFSVVAVTYGTNHVLEEGPPWARLMARFGSRSMADRFGYSFSGGVSSATAGVVVWTQWASSNLNSLPRFVSVVDTHGHETEPVDVALSRVTIPKKGGTLVAWRFQNYPRLQKEFALRFYDYDLFHVRAKREGETVIRNPVPITRSPVSAPVAPIEATNGALECTLVSLRCGGPPPRRPLTAKNAIAPWVTADFEFRENGLPTTDWTVKRIEAFGATSNYFFGDRLVVELEEGRRVARFAGAFWQDEMDWKLVVEVAPTRNFPAESLWTVRLPTRAFFHEALTTNLQAAAYGLRQAALRVLPATVGLFEPRTTDWRTTSLMLNYTPPAPDLYVDLARAVDDQGRELRILNAASAWHGDYQADLGLVASATNVDLIFAIHRSRKLEFRVRPEFVSTNAPSTFPASGK